MKSLFIALIIACVAATLSCAAYPNGFYTMKVWRMMAAVFYLPALGLVVYHSKTRKE